MESFAKLFQTLADRLFDFFNFGRLVTIFVPGLITAIATGMVVGQLLVPVDASAVASGEPAAAGEAKPVPPGRSAPSGRAPDSVVDAKKHSGRPEKGEAQTGSPERARAGCQRGQTGCLLREQLTSDFARLQKQVWLVVLLALLLGFPLNIIGTRILSSSLPRNREHGENGCRDGDDPLLYPYREKSGWPLEFHRPEDNQHDGWVHFVYFAPFLKDKFSGDINYFDFFVTEYYRFHEASALFPLLLWISAVLGGVYMTIFGIRHGLSWDYFKTVLVGVLVTVLIGWSYWKWVVAPGVMRLARARNDLVRGVTAMMNLQHSKEGGAENG